MSGVQHYWTDQVKTELVCATEAHHLKKSKVKSKAVPLHAMETLGGRGGIAPTHSRPRR
jgi:hypothetical protein